MIWQVRTIMAELAVQMSALGAVVYNRQQEYLKLAEVLDARLMDVGDCLSTWRVLYERNKHLLR